MFQLSGLSFRVLSFGLRAFESFTLDHQQAKMERT